MKYFFKKLRLLLIFGAALGATTSAMAKVNVLASTSDLAALATAVGAEDIAVDFIAKGSQDPHFIETKPSFMTKASRADLVISIGLELEIGWLPSIVRGARNAKILPGSEGFLELGPLVPVLDKPSGIVTRAEGDVHPDGNPHVNLDPIRMGSMGIELAKRLSSLDPSHANNFTARAQAFQKHMEEKTKGWQARITKSGVKEVITYHKLLSYFFDRFKIANTVYLEPKPGIPPTTSHILEVVKAAKERKIPLVLVENFYDMKAAHRIAGEVPGIKTASVPVSVGGEEKIKTLDDLYEAIVNAIEMK